MIDQKQLTEWAKLAKNERVPDLEHRNLGRTAIPALIAEVERLRSALADAIAQMCSVSRELGELQGKASIMEHVHVLDDWREKCEGLEAERDAAESARDAARAERDASDEANNALQVKLDSLAPHGSCACSFDKPGDVCAHHSPALSAALADVAKLREALTTFEAWDSFPKTGRRWPTGEEMSYGACCEKRMMRYVAGPSVTAAAATSPVPPTAPELPLPTQDVYYPEVAGVVTEYARAIDAKAPDIRWLHVKTGGEYTVIGQCRIEATNTPAIAYRNKDGVVWVQPKDEFFGGRFERTAPPREQEGE